MLSAQVQHLLAYARTIARAPGEAAGHVDALREVGWSDEAVLAAALLAAYFGHLNRIVLALGVTLESDFERTCAPELQEEPMPLPWEALR
jgi:alkylhydroperoxidase family enzyme